MNHADHVRLIAHGVPANSGGRWLELGAGQGAFTLALRDLGGPDVAMLAVDRDATSLATLRREMDRHFPGSDLRTKRADFHDLVSTLSAEVVGVPAGFNGILAANALHFSRNQEHLLTGLRGLLAPGGSLVIVEYDAEIGDRWVPYPISFAFLATLAARSGYGPPRLLATYPSRYRDRIYAAALASSQP